jgi:hypothetical protein
MTSKQEHLANLQKHDWSYMMSDDGNVYRRGSAAATALQTAEQNNPELVGMYNSYHNWWWNDRNAGHPEPVFEAPKSEVEGDADAE